MQPHIAFANVAASLVRRIAVPAAAAATVIGALLLAEPCASAQVVVEAPPAPRVEIVPPAPAAGYIWAPGYWGWRGRGYGWYGGRWHIGRPGYAWAAPHWAAHGGRWHFAPGRWHRR